jgi:hypothetical protein
LPPSAMGRDRQVRKNASRRSGDEGDHDADRHHDDGQRKKPRGEPRPVGASPGFAPSEFTAPAGAEC